MLQHKCPRGPGIAKDDADIIGNSFNIPTTQKMSEMDRHLLDPMRERGYRVLENVGLVDQQFLKGGHFYINQGACEMIADGRIRVVNCEAGIMGFKEQGLVLENGKEVEADVVVFGTGFERMGSLVEDFMGKEVAERVGDIGHLDEEGESIGVS